MPQRIKDHFYHGDSSDLQELMYNVAGWAQNWGDVLWYLNTVAPHETKFAGWDVVALVAYVERLQRQGARFTTDYRQMYHELTSQQCQPGTPPDATRIQQLPLRKIADKWLEGLQFPAAKEEVIERAKANHAPVDVLGALRGLAKLRYPNMGVLLHEVCQKIGGHA